ncbi:MAG: MBL fold metallo-hydrolase [Candidatus Gastranaerophilales bacterium]|nr:MBL fold metallo-hydrolase [Candidatus Gastranaerophilales bacterium]
MKNNDFKVKFWGVRGSYPVACKDFLDYGGNTSCIEVTAGSHRIILDGGTGIIPLGDKIYQEHISSADNVFDRTPMKVTVLLSHVHQDHIQGLNFFKPINILTTQFSLFGYSGFDSNLDETLSELIYGKSFPLNLYDITADCSINDITEADVLILNEENERPVVKRIFEADDIKPKDNEVVISFMKSNSHPNFGVMCFKISYKNKNIVYATDTECFYGGSKKLELFAKDTDLLIHDSQYTTEDYLSNIAPKQGFGHSTFNMAYDCAIAANVKKLAFFHFDPSYNDKKLTNIENFFKNKNENCFFAKEGMEICI